MSLPTGLKVALVHDWLTGMRGGEKCLEAIAALFPQADIFTLVHVPGKVAPEIERRRITTSFVQRLPRAATAYRSYLPLFPLAVEAFDLGGYDLVVSTSHCAAKGVVTGPDTLHVSYCFTPMRYAWDQYHAYFGRLRGPKRWLVAAAMARLRAWDASSADRVDRFLTISRFVARRIAKYYRREAEVVYPPVDTAFFTPGPGAGDYYLVVSALVPYKRLDVVVRAADRLPYPVRIVGTGPEERRLKAMAGKGVDFLGWLDPDGLREAYRGCRAFLFPAEEDFGLTPVEAMACGKPVAAFGRGGVRETVVPLGAPSGSAPTGVLFDRQEPDALVEAVRLIEDNLAHLDPAAARERALGFSPERFSGHLSGALGRAWQAGSTAESRR